MSSEEPQSRRVLIWAALLFSLMTFTVSWWHWWTFQYGTFDLAFYVQALWLALRGQWQVSLLNVPLMGNHAEPIVFVLTPLFALWPHPMLFVAAQTLAFATMPFTAYRIGKRLELEPKAALFMALATLITPATFSMGIYEFHPEALAAPLLLLLIEARLAERYGRYWLWFIVVLSVKENMAPLLGMFCGVFAVLEWKRGRAWQLAWNILPAGLALGWLLIYGKLISPALNAGNVDYLQLYRHLGESPVEIIGNFFAEPSRAFHALRTALTQGNMLWALLLPFLLLPLFRPRWLLIAAPLLAQHLLSGRYSEWSIGAHYPAPLLPLFWMAAAETLRRLRMQTGLAAAVLIACVLAHFRFGEARSIARQLPALGATLEEREWKAQMIADVPDDASVTAGLGFLPHLATRERLVSLHHILKGLKTLSVSAYTPPPPADVVIIDYADTLTFNALAGYYHPWSRLDRDRWVPSSDRLLHDYLTKVPWQATSKNSLTVLRRGEPLAGVPAKNGSLEIVEATTLTGVHLSKRVPGALQLRMSWEISGERKKFPWLMLVVSDGVQLTSFIKGACAVEASAGLYYEDWTVIFPTGMKPGNYAFFAEFYDANEAAWASRTGVSKMPPQDPTYMLTRIDLGRGEIRPGDFGSGKAP
jgi:uncharacterized membrane protein